MNLLTGKEKKQILRELESFGVKPNLLFFRTGKERIRGFSGNLLLEELKLLFSAIRIETLGLYLLKQEKEGARLSLDACHILKPTNNILNITNEQAKEWLKGEDLSLEDSQPSADLKGFIIVKNKDNFLGSGKVAENRILNYLPKERRIR